MDINIICDIFFCKTKIDSISININFLVEIKKIIKMANFWFCLNTSVVRNEGISED